MQYTSRLSGFLICLVLAGCATAPSDSKVQTPASAPANALGNAEFYTYQLAEELFTGLPSMPQARFAVSTFVPVDSLNYQPQSQHPLMLLGHQLEQGMITEATRRGFITQDFKTTNDIIISSHADRVFTRDVAQLSALPDVDFYISGTITPQQEGAIVNARVINAKSKDVVAAATRFFPAELFWQRETVTHRNGMIYRTGSE